MVHDPPFDLFCFLIGNTGDHNRSGSVKHVSAILCIRLLAGGIYVAFLNGSWDPEQRTGCHFRGAGSITYFTGAGSGCLQTRMRCLTVSTHCLHDADTVKRGLMFA